MIKFHLFLKPYGAMCSVTKKKKHKKKNWQIGKFVYDTECSQIDKHIQHVLKNKPRKIIYCQNKNNCNNAHIRLQIRSPHSSKARKCTTAARKNNSCLLLPWIQILKIDHYSNFSIYQNSLQKTCPTGTKYSSTITTGLLS